jgi:hypothetical protein
MRALLLLMAVGCASGASSSYGSVTFKSFSNMAARPVAYSVGKGHVVGHDLDLSESEDCVRGNWGRIPLDFCRDTKATGPEQHWSGSSGAFTVAPAGTKFAVRGTMILDNRRAVSMDQDVSVGEGAQWDELKRHPALLAVAATAADLSALGLRR